MIMKKYVQGLFTGERALYHTQEAEIVDSTFADGESPLKESRNLVLSNCIFKWKYPLWYCHFVSCKNVSILDTARSGIWYTNDISFKDSIIEAPKTFRRSKNIVLYNVNMPNASETFWNCEQITLNNVQAQGDYFAMNCQNVYAKDFYLSGNYAFDGAKNVEIHHATLLSKDSFWNCDNVIVYDSTIIGEYLGWNSKNLTFVNCTIDSLQGFCYIENLRLINCKLLNTNLAFEFSTVDAEVVSMIDSIKNPISGVIRAKAINDIIFDEDLVDKSKTKLEVGEPNE